MLADADGGGVGIASSMFAECERDGDAWWASADVMIDPLEVRSVRAILCDPEGTTDAPELPCRASDDVFFSETRARVRCGVGDPAAGGHRYTLVRFVVD